MVKCRWVGVAEKQREKKKKKKKIEVGRVVDSAESKRRIEKLILNFWQLKWMNSNGNLNLNESV
jgi:hypothetical protein